MSLTKLLPVILLMMVTGVQASTRDEIERLWNPQGMAAQPAQPAADTSARTEKPAPRWFRLSNGRQVNLADWKVVLFMQGHCPYCHQFDPVLKQLAQQYGFSVFPYTLDGQGDTAFPEALPVPPDVMQTFFPNIPVATPTTFLVNVNTLEALPLLQGATDAAGFMARMDTVLQMYGGKKGAKKAGGVTHCRNIRHRDGNNRQPEYPLYPSGAFLSRQPCRNCRFAVPYLFCFCCVFCGGNCGMDFGV